MAEPTSPMMIGIDPHKHSHTAVAVDRDENVGGEVRVRADRRQLERLLGWAQRWPERVWAIEGAQGLGRLLAQRLVAAGECVIDVPATLSARVRLLDTGSSDKTDPHDAFSAAIAGLRSRKPSYVRREDHTAVLRMLSVRRKNLVSLRTQAVCRLHAHLQQLRPGGSRRGLTTKRATQILRGIRPASAVEIERKHQARGLLDDLRRLDRQIKIVEGRIKDAVIESGTSLIELDGISYILAAAILGHTGDVGRFARRAHYASYNGTAPIEASSGDVKRHRLNRRGNRQLNHALHMMALSQIGRDTPGRTYLRTKLAEGKGEKEARRALKRHLSNVVYKTLVADARQQAFPAAA